MQEFNKNYDNRIPRPRTNPSYKERDNVRGDNRTDQDENPEQAFKSANYLSTWTINEVNEQLPEFAEKLGKYMADNGLTNSKIRSIYCEIKRIQMGEFKKEKASFFLLKPKVAYALGRDSKNKGLKMFKIAFDTLYNDVTDQKSYNNFANIIEAILAYHKAYGGKD